MKSIKEQVKKRKKNREKYYSIIENRNKKRDDDKKYQQEKRARLKGYKTKEYRKYCKDNPEKVKAQQLLNYKIKKKLISRSPCEVCGVSQGIHGHHPNYAKPFEVIWLCPIHHKEIHKN